MLHSELTSIQGVGVKRANILFKKFKTLKAIKSANIEELSSVTGIDKKTAENIYRYFRK